MILFSLAFSALLANSVYPYEIDSGFQLEPVIGVSFQDKIYDSSVTTGLRFTYFSTDQRDYNLSPEAQFTVYHTFTGEPKTFRRYTGDVGLTFNEIYHPLTFRVAGGFGGEYRAMKIEPELYYRGGLGCFFSKDFSIFGDFGQKFIWRKKISLPLELTLSTQWIF